MSGSGGPDGHSVSMGKGSKVQAVGRGEQGRAVGRLAKHTVFGQIPKMPDSCAHWE